jgi:hypothetical protein
MQCLRLLNDYDFNALRHRVPHPSPALRKSRVKAALN